MGVRLDPRFPGTDRSLAADAALLASDLLDFCCVPAGGRVHLSLPVGH